LETEIIKQNLSGGIFSENLRYLREISMKIIDLNCDVAEGIGNEAELFPFISSCNISCGLHAGDDQTIREVIDLAIENEVAIMAHPSFDDRENFGRAEMHLPEAELKDLIQFQIQKLKEMTELAGAQLHHVKPHGALYNIAAKSAEVSDVIMSAIEEVDPNLILFGLAQSETQRTAEGRLKFVAEGFADRRYQSSQQLMARSDGGLLPDIEEIKNHVLRLVINHEVVTPDCVQPLHIDTLCVHGDSPKAIDSVQVINDLLKNEGFQIKAVVQ